jgi:hypothetical protein
MNIVLELGTSHGPRKQECCPHQGVFLLLVASSRESRFAYENKCHIHLSISEGVAKFQCEVEYMD